MMRRWIAIVLGFAGFIGASGGIAGMGLANYATSGSFDFYRQHSASAWRAELARQAVALPSTDPAFISDRRAGTDEAGAEPTLASLNL